jgi:septum formation protein
MAPQIDEDFEGRTDPCSVAGELAVRKVQKIVDNLKSEISTSRQGEVSIVPPSIPQMEGKTPLWVCGADTLISIDGKICGKPLDRGDAALMLRSLSGRIHEVIRAVAVYSGRTGKIDCRKALSAVTFASLSENEIEWYLDSGEWQDAAGAYKIQGLASCFITGISGSYSSIVGLPLREFYVMLKDNGYSYGA